MSESPNPPLPRLLEFHKLCGSGNDFVFLDGRTTTLALDGPTIAALCDRRRGIGADGLVRLTPQSADTVRLEYWNSDGSHAALCGNASLCSAAFSRRMGLVERDEFTLATDAGAVRARAIASDRAEIEIGDVAFPREMTEIVREPGELAIHFAIVGVPHLIVRVDDPARIDLARRGRELRFHPAVLPNGANVNFVSNGAHDGIFAIRTYERGVEGETLACGTGSTATGLTRMATSLVPTDEITLRTASGSRLTVRAERAEDRFTRVRLEGEGRLVFSGHT